MTSPHEVHELVDLDNYEPVAFYVKGHVSSEQFVNSVVNSYGIDWRDIPHDQIRQLYIRWDIANDGTGGWERRAHEYDEPGRGRFAVTQWYIR